MWISRCSAVRRRPARRQKLPSSRTPCGTDTLSLIAKKYYGNARKYVALAEANRGTLPHPDKIYPGMVVNIPALG
jgi:nucleoid-associated protein YgaU